MNPRKAITITIAITMLSGCVTLGAISTPKPSYTPPVKQEFNRDLVLHEQTDHVWNRFLDNLSSSDFSIEHSDQATGLIMLSVNSAQPEEYVDCGISYRSDNFAGQNREYSYQTAGMGTYSRTEPSAENVSLNVSTLVDRKTILTSTAQIQLSKIAESTQLSISIDYSLEVQLSGLSTEYKTWGMPLSESKVANTLENWARFSTSTTANKKLNMEGVACVSKGVLEEAILGLAQPK